MDSGGAWMVTSVLSVGAQPERHYDGARGNNKKHERHRGLGTAGRKSMSR